MVRPPLWTQLRYHSWSRGTWLSEQPREGHVLMHPESAGDLVSWGGEPQPMADCCLVGQETGSLATVSLTTSLHSVLLIALLSQPPEASLCIQLGSGAVGGEVSNQESGLSRGCAHNRPPALGSILSFGGYTLTPLPRPTSSFPQHTNSCTLLLGG